MDTTNSTNNLPPNLNVERCNENDVGKDDPNNSSMVSIMETKTGGNTKLQSRSRRWCFTVNNYKEKELTQILNIFKMKNWNFIIGKEIGKEGTPHLQGYVECKSPVAFTTLKKILERAHIEKALGTKEANIKYCSKENNYETNMEIKKELKEAGKLPEEEIILKEWQLEIEKIIEGKRNKRDIIWIFDKKGNNGKTTLARYICERFKNVMYFTGGKASDIASQIILNKKFNPDICIFDFPRTNEGKISYTAIESCKNGMINTPKYEGGFKIFPPPHVIIFANFKPEINKLNLDRWNIYELNKWELKKMEINVSKDEPNDSSLFSLLKTQTGV